MFKDVHNRYTLHLYSSVIAKKTDFLGSTILNKWLFFISYLYARGILLKPFEDGTVQTITANLDVALGIEPVTFYLWGGSDSDDLPGRQFSSFFLRVSLLCFGDIHWKNRYYETAKRFLTPAVNWFKYRLPYLNFDLRPAQQRDKYVCVWGYVIILGVWSTGS